MIRAAAAGALVLITFSAAGQEACFTACHGANGVSATPLTPSLGGQPSFFVLAQLFLFREGRRDNVLMNAAAKGLSDADLQALADRIAKLPPPGPPQAKPDQARFARGRAVAEKERCANCHDPDFSGHDNVPRLANQREDYLLKALRDYKKGVRTGYGMAVMPETVSGLTDAELQDLAHFLAHVLSRSGR
ncbi:MAG TPA: c-type cytochrome [Burkholderiales bacterium]